MNIAVNCRLLQKGKLEGIGWFMYETLKRITLNHPEHHFIFIFDRPYNSEYIFASNVEGLVVSPPTRHPFLWYLWFEWRIPAVLKRIKADIFFSPDGYASMRSTVPLVAVIHDINFVHRPKDLPFWTRHYYNHFFPRFAHKAQRICTVSKYSQQDIHQSYKVSSKFINVVYNGANLRYRPLSTDACNLVKQKYSAGSDYFLFIGSIHPRKNLENLVKAYDLFIQKTGSDIKLLIVGASMWKKKAAEQDMGSGESLNLGSPCTAPGGPGKAQSSKPQTPVTKLLSPIFLGRLDVDELSQVLGAALALTFIPWFEGFGIPVLEALNAGVPVLTSTETSLPEVGGDAALYAHPDDVEEIAAQMERLAGDPNIRQELIEKGFKQKENFSWDKTANKVWESIDSVLKDNHQHDGS
ncbi:MAG: glycosyltransferase family 4 protein [Bacteroidales bacterium]|nr:glycosyltransferase family 4 protein [Bacteroidales bacterium]